jgi:hypothetical protein
VIVFVDLGLVGEEDEEVGVATVAETGCGALAKLLLDAGEPAFGALLRVVGAIEEICTIGAVAYGKEDVGSAGLEGEPGLRGEGVARVVAIGDEAVGGIAAACELLVDGALGIGGA